MKKKNRDSVRSYLANNPDTIIIDIPNEITSSIESEHSLMVERLQYIIRELLKDNVDIGELISQMHKLNKRKFF